MHEVFDGSIPPPSLAHVERVDCNNMLGWEFTHSNNDNLATVGLKLTNRQVMAFKLCRSTHRSSLRSSKGRAKQMIEDSYNKIEKVSTKLR
jgi:hypothetical protein